MVFNSVSESHGLQCPSGGPPDSWRVGCTSEELGNDSPHPGPAKVGVGSQSDGQEQRAPDTPACSYLLRFAILASTRHIQAPNLPSGHFPCTDYHILAFLTPSRVPCRPHPSTAVASRVRPVTLSLVLEGAGQRLGPHLFLPPWCHEPRMR